MALNQITLKSSNNEGGEKDNNQLIKEDIQLTPQ
jgi:hypothetical protein